MNLNDLLRGKGIDPKQVLVLRHRPSEPELNKWLPRLAAEKPDVFNAYQQTQGARLEGVMSTMKGTGYVAAFIGHEPSKALFVGLYAIGESKPLTREEYWRIPENVELKKFGMKGFSEEEPRSAVLWFDLAVNDFYESWRGKLIVNWPPPERSWWRRAHRNEMPILAILEDSALVSAMPEWNQVILTWEQLGVLPKAWKVALSQWRGIYYIFDTSTRKGYVGSAYCDSNILGRWLDYAASGHGGNRLLRERDPRQFRFAILQRVSPDMGPEEIINLEGTWKDRLHTRQPYGLNEN